MLRTLATLVFLLPATALAQTEVDGAPVPGQYLFKAVNASTAELVQDRIEEITGEGTSSMARLSNRLNMYIIKYPPPPHQEDSDAINEIFSGAEDDGSIIWNEPNRIIDAHGQTGSLWVSGLGIDATSYRDQYAARQMELQRTHADNARGAGTLVAIIDTGIDPDHPALEGRVSDLGANMIVNQTETDDSGNGVHAGHGTFVAGLVALVAPDARLLPVTVLKPDGTGVSSDVADGILHAVDQGAHVIVLALGTTTQSNAMREAIDIAIMNGATVLAAAGNTLPSPTEPSILFPASYNGLHGGNIGVLAVGGCNSLGHHATMSNYHWKVALCAPAETIMRSDGSPDPAEAVIGPLPGGEYAAGNGTSFSTGFAAGVAALARSQHRSWPDEHVVAGMIAYHVTNKVDESTTYVTMPAEPSNPIEDKPMLNAYEGTATGPGLTVIGDMDGDGKVDGRDLAVLLGAWGPLPANGSLHNMNLIPDDLIDGADLSMILGSWHSHSDP